MDGLRLLVVDDEEDFRETVVKRMVKRHVIAQGAESGEKALEWLADNEVDVVVLDVRMPGMDGIQALQEIKRRYPLVEVVMLTGHASMELAIEGMELGAFDYLMKPIEMDALLYKIQDAHKKKSIQEAKIRGMEGVAGSR